MEMTDKQVYKELRGKLHSTQIIWGDGTMMIQVCYDGSHRTDQKIVDFLKRQGFSGQGIEKLMGSQFEWLVKNFRAMTKDERMLA